MDLLRTPRGKLLTSFGLLFALLLAPRVFSGAVGFARWLLAGACAIGLGLWFRRSRSGLSAVREAPPLQVKARAGLSPRCAVALVEVGGRSFLIAHGDGFARIHPLPRDAERMAFTRVLQ